MYTGDNYPYALSDDSIIVVFYSYCFHYLPFLRCFIIRICTVSSLLSHFFNWLNWWGPLRFTRTYFTNIFYRQLRLFSTRNNTIFVSHWHNSSVQALVGNYDWNVYILFIYLELCSIATSSFAVVRNLYVEVDFIFEKNVQSCVGFCNVFPTKNVCFRI